MSQLLYDLNIFLLSLCLGACFYAASPKWASAQENASANPAPGPSPVVGWIEIEPVPGKPDHVAIIGKVYGLKPCEGRYSLEVRRHERGNVSNSAQGGSFKTAQGETASLSRTATNVPPTSSLEIVLRVQVEGREVFTASLRPAT